jgi:Uma2 family endonuclease
MGNGRPSALLNKGHCMSPATLKLTLADYEHMVEKGAFDWLRDRRIELIRGEIREMMAANPLDSVTVTNLSAWSIRNAPLDGVNIRVHDPVGIPELDSAPQPDIVWVRRRDYSERHPRSSDVLLIIEVADATYEYDTGEKLELYAECGIKDYWVVNVKHYRIEVFRKPRRGVYTVRDEIDYESTV